MSGLPAGWTAACLSDVIASVRSGVSVNSEDRETRACELGVLKTSCVTTGSFRASEHKAVVAADLHRVSEPVGAETVIVSRMNTIDLVGASAYVSTAAPHLYLPDRLWAVRAAKGVSARWLAFVVGSPAMRVALKSAASGTSGSMKNLSQESFLALPLDIPPLQEQRRIVEVLDAWDQAIAQTEQMAAAKQKRLVNTRKLLLSNLPEPEIELGEMATLATGSPAPQAREAFAEQGVRFVRVSDLPAFLGEQADEPEYVTPAAARGMRPFGRGTILFAKSGMSCKLARVVRLPMEARLVSHLGAVNAKAADFQPFLYHWLVEHPPSALVQGDGFPSIRITEVAAMPVPGVSSDTAVSIGTVLDSLEADIASDAARLALLRTQKRGLMQKLLTGEWRLGDGRAEVAA